MSRPKKEDSKYTAYWCDLKDDLFVIFTLSDNEAIAFQKDKTMKKIPYRDIPRNAKRRELGTFYDYKLKRFQSVAKKVMELNKGTGEKREKTAMEITKTFINFVYEEEKLKFRGNRWSISILDAYAIKSSYKEELDELKESQVNLKKELENAKKAGKGVTAASRAVDDMKLSIDSLNDYINKENTRIKEYKNNYDKEKKEQAEEAEKKKEQAEKKRKEDEIAEKKRLADWNRPLPRDATMWKGDYKPKSERKGK
ncbi:uncharacterized protein Bfra_007374 [Botrytis fragariae]|uniref:Uncharacterized protein n=1 Tax=Botrytis fragariae TaxID=1964551 RepID=A0A8H6AI26_9HELO|nr:uncharacterized protein Bfra_007374 [Botrytis fragariae]KAF5868178.1 hypothetical protein Bfra_007374 [Botrytis fragariae]